MEAYTILLPQSMLINIIILLVSFKNNSLYRSFILIYNVDECNRFAVSPQMQENSISVSFFGYK